MTINKNQGIHQEINQTPLPSQSSFNPQFVYVTSNYNYNLHTVFKKVSLKPTVYIKEKNKNKYL